MRKHLLFAALAGLALRLLFVLRFPMGDAGDTPLYEELARNWLSHHVYGLFLYGHLMPVDLRAPGYPAFLALVYTLFGTSRLAVLLAQAALDLVTCLLIVALAARLAPQPVRQRVAIAALWLAATCPFVANYAAVALSEVLATFLTALALLVFADPLDRIGSAHPDSFFAPPVSTWFVGGLVIGLGTLVRPETPLILMAVMLALGVRWCRGTNWGKLSRAGFLMVAGFAVPLVPWAARNWHTLHEVQFLAPRYSELPGELVPHGFNAWTRTWLVRFRDVYLVPWKLDEEPIRIEDVPASAFDSAEERARVAVLLERYNTTLTMSPEVDREFREIARERTARHPLRTYLRIPLERAAVLWFTPRVELLPVSGHLWPLGQQWREDRVDFCVTLGFGMLNFVYVGLALAGAWRGRGRAALMLLVALILVRTAFFMQTETPEPRYVLECFPAVLALAALVWARPRPSLP